MVPNPLENRVLLQEKHGNPKTIMGWKEYIFPLLNIGLRVFQGTSKTEYLNIWVAGLLLKWTKVKISSFSMATIYSVFPRTFGGGRLLSLWGFSGSNPSFHRDSPMLAGNFRVFRPNPIILGPKPIIIEQKQQNLVAAWLKDSCQAQRIQTAESSSNIGWPGTQGRTLIRTEPTTSLEWWELDSPIAISLNGVNRQKAFFQISFDIMGLVCSVRLLPSFHRFPLVSE